MTAVLDASKTGNLNELKRLKEAGASFQEADVDGNTALLWAGSLGHLKVVQWLLSAENGSSSITERNNNGNTVLLLAATFGHLEVVRWLLSPEGGANIEECNSSSRTALLQATVHGQLPVIDYLIRTHYLEQGIDEKLRQQLILHTKHKSVHYYFEALDIFSQKKVDEGKLSLLLAKASSQLKFEELSYIYLICGWMQVLSNSKITNSFNQDIVPTHQHFMTQLIGDHQQELLIKMFEQGHILLDWFIDENKLAVTDIRLDDSLCQLIQNLLNQSEHDRFLKLQSAGKQKSLFLDSYLKPIYYSMLSAVQRKSSVENALQDPYTYHLNCHEDLNIEPDCAKWTAYHLSQRLHASMQTHQNAYGRMRGLSRQIYYDTVKEVMCETAYILCLKSDDFIINGNHVALELDRAGTLKYVVFNASDSSNINGEIPGNLLGFSPGDLLTFEQLVVLKSVILELISNNGHIPLQKKSLLLTLGNLPEVNGERLQWAKEFPNWRRNLSRELSTENHGQDNLALIGEEQQVSLHHRFVQQIWDSEQHVPRPTEFPGNHPVYKLELSSGKFVFCKLYPGLPGINDSLQYLYRRLFGAQGGLPWSVTGLLKIDNQTIPVLFSEDVGSMVEENDLRLSNLDRKTLSKLILFCLLTNPEDGKLANLTLIRNLRGSYDIFSVDNDQGLVEPTKENYSWFGYSKKPSLFVKSLLFCLDAMKEPLDEEVVREFLSLDSMETLKAWLNDLIPVAEAYEALFDGCKSPNEEPNPYRKSYLNLALPVVTVFHIAYKMQRIKTLLEEYDKTTPLKLLESVEPVVFSYYDPVLQLPLSATDRFDKLVKEGSLYRWCEKTKSYSSTVTCANEVFDFLVSDNRGKDVNPKIALEELEQFHQRWETFDLGAIGVIKGEIAKLLSLKVEDQQALLKHTLLNQMSTQRRKLLLEVLAKQKYFNELYLRYPQDSLTDSLLMFLLTNNKTLEHLSITNGLALTSLSAFNGASALTHLKLSQLPQIKEFIVTLPNVTELVLKDLPQLSLIQIKAPHLRSLRIIDCMNLEKIEAPESKQLSHVEIQGCRKIVLANFYMQWPGFLCRWHNVLPQFRERVVNCINSLDIGTVSKEDVYSIVSDYLEPLNQFCQSLFVTLDYRSHGHAIFSSLLRGITFVNLMNIRRADVLYFQHNGISAFAAPQREERRVISELKKILGQDDRCAVEAAVALATFNVNDERIIPILLRRLRYSLRSSERISSAIALGIIHTNDSQVIPALINALDDEIISVRIAAIISLITHQAKDERVILAVRELLTDKRNFLDSNYSEELMVLAQKLDLSLEEPVVQGLLMALGGGIVRTLMERYISLATRVHSTQLLSLIDEMLPNYLFIDSIISLVNYYQKPEAALITQLQALNLKENINKTDSVISLSVDNQIVVVDEEYEGFILIPSEDEIRSTSIIEEHVVSSPVAALVMEEIHTSPRLIIEDEQDEINSVSPIALVAESSNEFTVSELMPKGSSLENKNNFFNRHGYHIKVGVGVLPTDVPPDLFSIAERGDLTQLVKDLSKKDAVNVFTRDKEGNSALVIAAKKGHLAVLDHLIRHYYVTSGFDDKEKQALKSSEHLAIRHYLDLFAACSEASAYDDVLQLLDKAVGELGEEEHSFIYLMYLWMQVHHRAHSPSHAPQMHQLQRPHQMELIQYMIQEGHVLNDWAINSEELVIRDMTLDEQRVDALAPLLEHSAYEFSLMDQGGLIEPNKIYLKLIGQALQYQVMTCSGAVVTDQIDGNLLKCNLTHPFSLDQLKYIPELLKIISSRGHIRSIINMLTFDNVHFTEGGYESFLKLLKNPLFIPWMQTLKLNHCHLNDKKIEKLSTNLINRSELTHLDLDNNNITRKGLKDLFDAFSPSEASVKLNTLSLCFNNITITALRTLNDLEVDDCKIKIKLKGNMIADNDELGFERKKAHKRRVNVLRSLFSLISNQAPDLTIDDFLTATNLSLKRGQNEDDYLLRLTLKDLRTIEILTDRPLFDSYNKLLPIQESSHDLHENVLVTRAQKIFSYLKAGIIEKDIPQGLRHFLLSQGAQQKRVCKQLLDYHPDARLKGHLMTHSLFSSSRIEAAPSYLLPEIQLTLEQGVVYFFSRKDTQHSMLGYEYLTGYGQRILKIVHLRKVREENDGVIQEKMKILLFDRTDLPNLINTLHEECDIAWIPAKTIGIKRMRDTIEEDLTKKALSGQYKKAIMPSSRDEGVEEKAQIKNCVTYCVDKINEHQSLGFKLIVSGYWFFEPSSIVNAIKNDPGSIIEFNSPMLQMKQ
ncbi:ankyrin repeat domain-containing protein [Legionella rowbothamii]|uniref:ankyrin repeat domain-containing protein n=1 Tax=Legionella rowbothamii TaxID=96229 RepID=UPI0013EF5F43|nr:ankyrin repeat domain-containing protein [Legionella rowbothamii]